MPFIGNQPALSYTSFAKQDFTTSATTSYTLDNPVANANELALFINFVRQEPTTAYSASGTSLTLTSATSATDDMYCVFLGKAVQTVNPPNASVGLSQLTATGTKDATTFLRGDNTFAVAGGDNTPAFKVTLSSNQTIADDTLTRVAWDTEEYDTNSAFASNIFTVPSGEGGKYVFEFHVFGDDIDDGDVWSTYLELDGTAVVGAIAEKRGVSGTNNCAMNNTVTVTCTAGQTIEVVTKHQGTSASQEIRSNNSFFSGYKIIE